MSESLSTALMLMGVGMITVFVVLSLVVMVGNGLTIFVNKFIPEPAQIEFKKSAHSIEPGKLAAMTAAVEIFTKSKGRITQIDKIE